MASRDYVASLDKGLQVRLRCDRTLKYKDYGPVYNAIGAAGGTIAIIHELRSP